LSYEIVPTEILYWVHYQLSSYKNSSLESTLDVKKQKKINWGKITKHNEKGGKRTVVAVTMMSSYLTLLFCTVTTMMIVVVFDISTSHNSGYS
jgi:hypothetical protein